MELDIIFWSETKDELVGYINSDLVALKDEQKSTDEYIYLFSEGPVSYQSKQQATFALLTTETKYMAITKAEKEAL